MKVEGPQSIPSALYQKYRAAITLLENNGTLQKRCPFRLPKMQSKKGAPSLKQKVGRAKFLTQVSFFNSLDGTDRSEWYSAGAAVMNWLWYYCVVISYLLKDAVAAGASFWETGYEPFAALSIDSRHRTACHLRQDHVQKRDRFSSDVPDASVGP